MEPSNSLTVTVNNAVRIAECLVRQYTDHDIVKYDPTLAGALDQLRELLHQHRYASAQHRPQGLTTIEWIEQTLQQLIAQTQHCLAQLTTDQQQTLLNTVNQK